MGDFEPAAADPEQCIGLNEVGNPFDLNSVRPNPAPPGPMHLGVADRTIVRF